MFQIYNLYVLTSQILTEQWGGHSSVAGRVLSIHEVLGSAPSASIKINK